MAKGMKIAKGSSPQIDVSITPEQINVPITTTTNETVYFGGVGGNPNVVNTLTIKVYYKDTDGVAYSNGYIDIQKGRKQFQVLSTSTSTITRATLIAVTATTALTTGTMAIKAVDTSGAVFYASRITNKFVWNGNTRYRYATVSSGTLNAVDTANATLTYAVVEGV
jgi:hypothetical protein